MELEFVNKPMDCLRQAVWEIKDEEQTQELKLTDGMPDVGRVLGAWGQLLIRSKEWRGSGMSISGGTLVWVLYEPEDAGELQTVETWVPFSMRWDFPQTKQDGSILINALLRTVDARSVSARKLMIRTVVSAAGQALEPYKQSVYYPEHIPEDVQLLKTRYPICIPAEAGEKAFSMDDQLVLPSNMPDIHKILACNLYPGIREQKIVAGKAVMRGIAKVYLVYLGVDGVVCTRTFDLPFSQYADLDREYEENARLQVSMMVTDLEPEIQGEGRLRLKCGLVGQYVVYDHPLLEVVEDAYSTTREVTVKTVSEEIFRLLDYTEREEDPEYIFPDAAGKGLHAAMLCGQPVASRSEKGCMLRTEGNFHLMYSDADGEYRSASNSWQDEWELCADRNAMLQGFNWVIPPDIPVMSAGGMTVRGRLRADVQTVTNQGIHMVCGLDLGQQREPDPARPALILRRAGEESLWELAKRCGTTREAICSANGLEEDPPKGKMLLIPVP